MVGVLDEVGPDHVNQQDLTHDKHQISDSQLEYLLDQAKEGVLIRELSSNSEPAFYTCTVFSQPRPLPAGALSCRWPAIECIAY